MSGRAGLPPLFLLPIVIILGSKIRSLLAADSPVKCVRPNPDASASRGVRHDHLHNIKLPDGRLCHKLNSGELYSCLTARSRPCISGARATQLVQQFLRWRGKSRNTFPASCARPAQRVQHLAIPFGGDGRDQNLFGRPPLRFYDAAHPLARMETSHCKSVTNEAEGDQTPHGWQL
jgi:hypothetical protein